ncbi:MAG: hypothetical protein IPL33_20440 [Sphingobacteriales bacterium]|nr:hypothetical protein [Sphingobacteriales bacterium]
MKINILLLTMIALLAFYCKRSNTIVIQNKEKSKQDVFYKVTNRPLSRYFKNSADTALLGRIVYTHLLDKGKYANDTMKDFFIKLDLCDAEYESGIEQVYVPCDPYAHGMLLLNEEVNDTLIGTTNHLFEYYGYPHENDSSIFTEIFTKDKNTGIYNNTQTLSAALIGYYIDGFDNKRIILHDEVFYFGPDEDVKARLENALVLYKWQNGKYVPDSLLTIDGELIPKKDYPQAYEKYMGDSDY